MFLTALRWQSWRDFFPTGFRRHPALAIVIGITVLLGLLLLHRTRPGFWLIGGVLSVVWGFIFATMAYEFSGKDMVWTYVVWALGAVLVFALHLRARYKLHKVRIWPADQPAGRFF